MENTPMDIIGIMIGAVLLFLVPLFLVADRADDISQLSAQTTTADFINEVVKEGVITSDNYQRFTSTLFSLFSIGCCSISAIYNASIYFCSY